MSQDPDRQLVTQIDLLPRSQLQLRGGVWRPQPVEQVVRQAIAYLAANGPNGSVLVKSDGAGVLQIGPVPLQVSAPATAPIWDIQQPSTAQFQQVTHAVNSIVLPAAGAGLRNILTMFSYLVQGTGTAPTQAAPEIITISDGATVIFQINVAGFMVGAALGIVPLPPGGIAGTPNTSMTISAADPGLSNSTTLNIASYTG